MEVVARARIVAEVTVLKRCVEYSTHTVSHRANLSTRLDVAEILEERRRAWKYLCVILADLDEKT